MPILSMTMLGNEPLTQMIKLVLQSGYIKNSKSVSLLILAPPESAKTESMTEFKKIPDTYYTNDITPKPMTDKILPMIDKGEVTHIIIPDILNCIERNRATAKQLINFFKSLIEEGITKLDAFNLKFIPQYKEVIQCGLITAITTGNYLEVKRDWEKIGFLSRMMPFSYTYTKDKIKTVYDYIANESYIVATKNKTKQSIKRKIIEVKGNPNLFKQFEMLSITVGSQIGCYGIRLQKNFQTLAKANAILNNRIEIIQEDIDEIFRLSKWINYEFNPM